MIANDRWESEHTFQITNNIQEYNSNDTSNNEDHQSAKSLREANAPSKCVHSRTTISHFVSSPETLKTGQCHRKRHGSVNFLQKLSSCKFQRSCSETVNNLGFGNTEKALIALINMLPLLRS